MKKLIAVLLCTLLLTSAAALAEDYTFGTDTAFRPFEYTDETGTLVGIDVELLADCWPPLLKTRVSHIPLSPWAGMLPLPPVRQARKMP